MTVSIEPAKTTFASLIEIPRLSNKSEISRNQRIGSLVPEFPIGDKADPGPSRIAGCTQPKRLLFPSATRQPHRFHAARQPDLVGHPRQLVFFPAAAQRTGARLRPSARAR